MTQRTEWQQRKLELKARLTNWVGNRLFSLKNTGVDGFVKKQVAGSKPQRKGGEANNTATR